MGDEAVDAMDEVFQLLNINDIDALEELAKAA